MVSGKSFKNGCLDTHSNRTPNGFPSLFFIENGLNHVPFLPGIQLAWRRLFWVVGYCYGCAK